MKKTRRRYDQYFKISIVSELDGGKSPAQIAHERGIHPNIPIRRRQGLAENPEKAFAANGNRFKYETRIAELERLLGQAHAENDLFKKSLRAERLKPTLRDDTRPPSMTSPATFGCRHSSHAWLLR